MLRPDLCSGVEKWHKDTGLWINSLSQNTFGLVAQTAGEPQVLFYILPTFCPGDDVFQSQRYAADDFLRQAITAPVACLFCDAFTQDLGRCAHVDSSNSWSVGER